MVALAAEEDENSQGRLTRRMGTVTIDEVMATVADVHEVEPEEYVGFRSLAAGREMAALLCRRYTSATLAELSERFGLGHPDSSANLVRRAKRREEESALFRRQIARAESQLAMKTEIRPGSRTHDAESAQRGGEDRSFSASSSLRRSFRPM